MITHLMFIMGLALHPTRSNLERTRRKPTGPHKGMLRIQSIKASLDEKKELVSLKLAIDMNSLTVIDVMPAKWQMKLGDHLKSADFLKSNCTRLPLSFPPKPAAK